MKSNKQKATRRATAKTKPATKSKTAAKPSVKRCAVIKAAPKKTAVTRPKGNKTVKKTRSIAPALSRNALSDAREVSVTENKICVSTLVSRNEDGRYTKQEVRKYYDKTPENMALLQAHVKRSPMKKMSVRFK